MIDVFTQRCLLCSLESHTMHAETTPRARSLDGNCESWARILGGCGRACHVGAAGEVVVK